MGGEGGPYVIHSDTQIMYHIIPLGIGVYQMKGWGVDCVYSQKINLLKDISDVKYVINM
jgi:hypothetical protein